MRTIALISDPECTDVSVRTTFDIDSVGGYVLSLVMCKQELLWYFISSSVSDLQFSLHLASLVAEYTDEQNQSHQQTCFIHQIPHLQFSHVAGFEAVMLYILFSQLYHSHHEVSQLEDAEFVT